MDFGKCSPHSGIDFSVARSLDLRREKPSRRGPMKIHLGCPVWQHPTWNGRVFLPGTSARDHLARYADVFGAVEVNATFYKIPDPSTVAKWASQVPSDFRFVVKIPRQISHDAPLSEGVGALHAFLESVAVFEEKLGMVFLQLPPHFSPADRQELAALYRAFPASVKLAIEFRDPRWFESRVFNEKAAQWFADRNISLVITDTGGRRDVSHGVVTSNRMMVRFLGNELHPTDYSRIDTWVERITEWEKSGIEEVYFFMHQPNEETAPDLISFLFDRLKDRPEFETRFAWPKSQIPSQASLF